MTKAVEPVFEQRFKWTLEQYHAAIDAGVLTENDKVELLFGELYVKMPVGEPHADILSDIADFFYELFGTQYKYRAQSPVTLPQANEPEPDFAVVTRKKYNRKTGHPGPEDILLLIEVADHTLSTDRNKKAKAYAAAGIKEYWIVNIPDRKVEVHLNPVRERGEYGVVSFHIPGTIFESPFCGTTAVDDLLASAEEE